MKTIHIFLFLLLGPLFALGQSNFKPGYLVTSDQDTLNGYVAFSKADNMAFKEKENGERSFYPLDDLIGYQIEGDRYERHLVDVRMSKFPERRNVFLKVLIDGPVRLLEYNGESLFGEPNVNLFLLHPGLPMPWIIPEKDKSFQKQVSTFFGEYEELSEEIRSGEAGYDQLTSITIRYNVWSMAQPDPEQP